MATIGLVFLAVCATVHAFPEEPTPYRNTIFNDEKLEGQIFEDVNLFTIRQPSTRRDSIYRLPTKTRPTHYDITWKINITQWMNLSEINEFSGTVDIDLHATEPMVNEIIIHSHELKIDSVVLKLGDTLINQTHSLVEAYDFLQIRLVTGTLNYNATNPVMYRLSIAFNATLRDDMSGIYRSWYYNYNKIHWMASTQFQSTSARSAFPCYDEPSFKSTFNVTIRRPVGFKSWSCTRQLLNSVNAANGFEDDVYLTTPIMSTYLLAIIVSEYKPVPHTEVIDGTEEITYEVIGRQQAIDDGQGKYAFEVGQNLLKEMSQHTAVDFYEVHPNIKMTQAAIPDFSAGAMENWGLLTYREAYLLYDENHTNSYYKQLIAYILSHEITHMWFGNLVTCDWWDVLWLNEGFASYYQYFLTNEVEGYMEHGSRFIPEQVHTALLADSDDSPQPLSNTGVGSKGAVNSMFSTISYNKGAAVIRMTEHLMGSENHRQGLRKYLRTRAHQTAVPTDLFQDLHDTALETNAISAYGADFSIVDYYKSWTDQGGHPVLNVNVNRQTGVVTIYQRRFNINSGYSTANINWIVPITFTTSRNPDFNNTKPTHIIREAITTLDLPLEADEWIIFNKQQTGFYRVNYDDYSWDLIINTLRGSGREKIHEHNRAQIVNDVFQFARSGLMTYTRAFNILSFLRTESDYTPWVAALSGFQWIRNRLIGTGLELDVNMMFRAWAEHVMTELNYEESADESFMTSYLRYQLAPMMCSLGDQGCIDSAKTQFDRLLTGTEVPVDSRGWVYCNALRQGNPQHFEFLLNRFKTHQVYTEKIVILSTLGCTTDQQSLNEFLDHIVEENFYIRKQDYRTAYNSAVSGNEKNTQWVFEYIQDNIEKVRKGFGSLITPLSYISSRLRTKEQVTQFRDWALEHQMELGAEYQTVYNSAESSLRSIAWAEKVQADMQNYLTFGDTPVSPSTVPPSTTTPAETYTVPSIQEPATPNFPDSANTSFLSALLICLAVVANLIL